MPLTMRWGLALLGLAGAVVILLAACFLVEFVLLEVCLRLWGVDAGPGG